MPLGSFCPRGCWFLRAHSLNCPPNGGRQRTWRLALRRRSSGAHAHKQCAHEHTAAACTPCPLNQSALPSLSFLYKRLFCSWVTRTKLKDVRDLLPLNWLLAAALPPYASWMDLRTSIITFEWLVDVWRGTCRAQTWIYKPATVGII